MVFNRAARDLLRRAGDQVQVVAHDWWAYMVVTGCGGRVVATNRKEGGAEFRIYLPAKAD